MSLPAIRSFQFQPPALLQISRPTSPSSALRLAGKVLIGSAALVLIQIGGRALYRLTRYLLNSPRYAHIHKPPIFKGQHLFIASVYRPDGGMLRYFNAYRDPLAPSTFLKIADGGALLDGSRSVNIADPEAFKEILNHPLDYPQLPLYVDMLTYLVGKGLLTLNGQQWALHRKLLTPLFHFAALKLAVPVVCRGVADSLAEVDQQAVNGHSIQPAAFIKSMTLAIIIDAAFGGEFDKEWMISMWDDAIDRYNYFLKGIQFVGPVWTIFPHRNALGFGLQMRRIRREIRKSIRKRKRSRTPESRDMLEMMMDDGSLSEEDMVNECLTFLVAGHDTTSNAILWSLFFIGTIPDVQRGVFNEVGGIMGNLDELPNGEALGKMAYTRCVLKEAMRLRPPVTSTVRLASKELTVDNQRIPKGTVLRLMFWNVHRDSRYFDQPEEFLPSRWETDVASTNPYAFLPFAAGGRNCIGQKFAMQEAIAVIAMIVRRYQVGIVDPECVTPVIQFPVMTPHGIRISLDKRNQ